MRLKIEKVNRRLRAKARGTKIAKRYEWGRRHIMQRAYVDERGRPVVATLHATKGWRIEVARPF